MSLKRVIAVVLTVCLLGVTGTGRAIKSPTTGLDVPDERFLPVVVSISNDISAVKSGGGEQKAAGSGKRTPWGLQHADILYEYPLYSNGTTRFAALYSDALMRGERVVCGPVRSMRNADAHVRESWQGVLVHSAAPKGLRGDAALDRFLETPIDDFSLTMRNQSGAEGLLWRLAGVKAPSNLCADVTAIQAWFSQASQAKPMCFADAAHTYADASAADRIELDWGKTECFTAFTYDSASGQYLREVNGVPSYCFASDEDRSEESRVRLAFDNVIVQHVAFTQPGTSVWLMMAASAGEADVFMDGRHISGRWERTAADQRTVFYDEAGQEIALMRGKTYIALFPTEAPMTVE